MHANHQLAHCSHLSSDLMLAARNAQVRGGSSNERHKDIYRAQLRCTAHVYFADPREATDLGIQYIEKFGMPSQEHPWQCALQHFNVTKQHSAGPLYRHCCLPRLEARKGQQMLCAGHELPSVRVVLLFRVSPDRPRRVSGSVGEPVHHQGSCLGEASLPAHSTHALSPQAKHPAIVLSMSTTPTHPRMLGDG